MAYTLQTQYDSIAYTSPQFCPAVFAGYPRVLIGFTIHHWGLKGQNFNTVRDFLCTNGNTSAHYVAQDGLVACIVDPANAAWHAGNPKGNAQTIGIECRPEATDGDYATIAELIADLRALYGDLPLFPHNYWTGTACPGDYDLARLDRMARAVTASRASGATSPTALPKGDAPLSSAEVTEIKAAVAGMNKDLRQYLGDLLIYGYQSGGKAHPGIATAVADVPAKVWGTPVKRANGNVSALQELADAKTYAMQVKEAVSALRAEVKAGAVASGIDPATIEKVLADATAKALGDVSLTFTKR